MAKVIFEREDLGTMSVQSCSLNDNYLFIIRNKMSGKPDKCLAWMKGLGKDKDKIYVFNPSCNSMTREMLFTDRKDLIENLKDKDKNGWTVECFITKAAFWKRIAEIVTEAEEI
jgi:hypothetical protein